MDNEPKEISNKNHTFRVTEFSRRQFLKRTGLTAAGMTLTAIAFSASCKTAISTTQETPTAPATQANNTTSSTSASATTSTSPASIPSSSTSATTNTTAPVSAYAYTPPSVLPPVLTVTGTACVVATDRVYSADHIWVKTIATSTNIAVIGITTTLDEILYEPFKISLPKVGDKIAQGDAFGTIEGYKMTSDLLTPVSGTVIQINDFLNSLVIQGTVLEPVINDPYNSGWMIVVQLAKPNELAPLLTAQAYRDLVAHS